MTDTTQSGRLTLTGDLDIIGAEHFYRVGPAEFGMPGLLAIQSVGPFVDLASMTRSWNRGWGSATNAVMKRLAPIRPFTGHEASP